MAAKTPLNSQITCVDDITTSDLLDGCIVEVLATKLVHHTAKGVFFVQCGRITVGGKMEIATLLMYQVFRMVLLFTLNVLGAL